MDKASLIKNANTIVKLTDCGYPGYLTEEEFAIFVSWIISMTCVL